MLVLKGAMFQGEAETSADPGCMMRIGNLGNAQSSREETAAIKDRYFRRRQENRLRPTTDLHGAPCIAGGGRGEATFRRGFG